MSKTTVDLLELSDFQKTEFLKSTRAYLKQQVEEKRYCNSISLSSLEKDNTGLESNLTIKGIDEMSNLKSIIEKIRSLEEEKKSLVLEIEELKKLTEAKATTLESEVNALREEVKSLKNLMTELEPKADRRLKK
jgi:uncharacterized protein (UPF0335 family)